MHLRDSQPWAYGFSRVKVIFLFSSRNFICRSCNLICRRKAQDRLVVCLRSPHIASYWRSILPSACRVELPSGSQPLLNTSQSWNMSWSSAINFSAEQIGITNQFHSKMGPIRGFVIDFIICWPIICDRTGMFIRFRMQDRHVQ